MVSPEEMSPVAEKLGSSKEWDQSKSLKWDLQNIICFM